jgi:hypothetical protein
VRQVNNLQDVQIVLNDLLNDKVRRDTSSGNGKGRPIKNVGAGTEPTDVVTVAQLHAATGATAAIAQPPVVQQQTSPVAPVDYFGRIILPGVQVVANDVLAHRYHVRIPRDTNGSPLYKQINLLTFTLTAKIIPVTIYTLQLQVSTDGGITFSPMFSTGVSLPGGSEFIVLVPAFQIPTLLDDNQIRVDVLVADGTVAGVEGVLQGVYS